ncbi:hypothetical protein L249_6988 [Ophiocordyceps polyrhachis-furcata BCC 54312]|uniref:Diphthamide biosynthesis protein 4 n=1 Tax=Ophiocordyceps polyrhachis-furcata BCC 54312 TaxID=1330021 RepID=A0A367LLV3_9HYPO|nr:hypothetical protein L249_6988 [Ophiocordyceps polyrhachis-furcata BCC 54312]
MAIATPSASHLISLAKTLPPPLQRFLARWPPASIAGRDAKPTPWQEERPHPFRCAKDPITGKRKDPVYSQRRQAELVKMARQHGLEELLPKTTKGTEFQLARRVRLGLRVKGTGVGQKVKGHIFERTMIPKEEKSHVGNAQTHQEFQTASITHYEVLGLSSSLLDAVAQENPSRLVRQAYRRALLRNHPDKAGAVSSSSSSSSPSSSASPSSPSPAVQALHRPSQQPKQPPLYTVDQIGQAFAVLASPSRRADYDASLLRLVADASLSGPTRFQTGVENADLDDLPFDEEGGRWYRPCRCGNDKGYSFDEADLADAADEGLLIVGCLDCSLWLRVHFAAVDDEDETHRRPHLTASKK